MAVIYRTVTGPISGADGTLLASGTLKAKLLSPLVDGTTFIANLTVETPIAAGVVSLSLAAPGNYQFIVATDVGETLWSFQTFLEDSSAADISLAELYLQEITAGSTDNTEVFATFLSLLDTPLSFEGHAGETLRVNATEDGIEFV